MSNEVSDDRPFLDAVLEMSMRRIQDRMDADATGYMGTVSSRPPVTLDAVKAGLYRCAELLRQMQDTPEPRFQQTRLIPRGQMFEMKEVQRDPKTGQAYRFVFIHPDDVPSVRAALLEQMASEPSLLRPLLPQGLESLP